MDKETLDFNSTPSSNRIHIGFFGNRNVGKSSLINKITNQEVSLVSKIKGTTTDPVSKAIEILPLGAVTLTDTPGFDDTGYLGEKRVEKTKKVINSIHIGVLVACGNRFNFTNKGTTIREIFTAEELEIIEEFCTKNIPFILILNKDDVYNYSRENIEILSSMLNTKVLLSNVYDNTSIDEIKNSLGKFYIVTEEKDLIKDVVKKDDIVILVAPIDSSAPKGRLILPQVQTIRDLLDGYCITIVVQPDQLQSCLCSLSKKPRLVITDSQVFNQVNKILPQDINLTSFSIIFARYKGILEEAVLASKKLKELKAKSKILISEGCTHHRQCDDIGTVKLPRWIEDFTGKTFEYEFTSGKGFPDDLKKYDLVVHCGGCMLNDKIMEYRKNICKEAGVPFTNYGILIAEINGILDKAIEIFKKEA